MARVGYVVKVTPERGSRACVTRFRLPHINLDISITRDINDDRRRRAMASALISFAEEMSVVAEGVETRAEFETLITLGVELSQGCLLGRPEPLEVH